MTPAIAFTIVMLGGLFQILFGLLRLGKWITLMPCTVISGFMSGIGVIILLLQIGPLFGSQSGGKVIDAVLQIPNVLRHTDPIAAGLGLLTLVIVFSVPPKLNKVIPAPLPNLFPSDFVDFNSYANNSAQDFSSEFFINNPLIITNAVDAAGGAGGAVDWNPGGGPISIRATYVAADAGVATDGGAEICAGIGGVGGDICGGGLDGDPNQATAEVEYATTFGASDQNNLAARLQYTRANTYNIEQNVIGANVEATLGQFGVFGRVGYSIVQRLILPWAPAVPPLALISSQEQTINKSL